MEKNYRFFRDEIEFCLTRHYLVRPIEDYSPLESRGDDTISPLSGLPAWDAVTPVDMQNRWILLVKSHVVQDNKPDEIRKVQDLLLAIRGELEGALSFMTIDRKVHDTRISLQQQGIQALPQKIKVGKN